MDIDRRHLIGLAAATVGARALPALAAPAAAPLGALGLEAAHFGLRPGSTDDQSRVLQTAIDEAARAARAARASRPASIASAISSCRPARSSSACAARPGSCFTEGPSLMAAAGADHVTLSGLALDGGSARSPIPAASSTWRVPRAADRRLRDRRAAAATASAASRSTARSAAIRSPTSPTPPSIRSTRAAS